MWETFKFKSICHIECIQIRSKCILLFMSNNSRALLTWQESKETVIDKIKYKLSKHWNINSKSNIETK